MDYSERKGKVKKTKLFFTGAILTKAHNYWKSFLPQHMNSL